MAICFRSKVFRAAALLVPIVIGNVQAADRKSGREVVKENLDRAAALCKKGAWEKAAEAYQRALFVDPKNQSARKGMKDVGPRIADALVEEAKAYWSQDKEIALLLLRKAQGLDPGNKALSEALKAHGYTDKGGEWLTESEAKNLKTLDKDRGERRRTELGLSPQFKVLRKDAFRFFTDVEGGDRKLRQMMTTIATHYRLYRGFFAAFPLVQPSEGLDVVLYWKKKDFERATDSANSLGVYSPKKGASFFFLTGAGDDFNTILHEMTHQLNDKVLVAWRLPEWFEEGSAEYFGNAFIKGGGASMEFGRATGYRMTDFLEAVRTKSGSYISFEGFLSLKMEKPDDPFYAQSWALVHYLLDGPFPGRVIAYDVVYEGTCLEKEKALDSKGFEKILARYGLTLKQFEQEFVEAYKSGTIK
jgi:hypothetical protein